MPRPLRAVAMRAWSDTWPALLLGLAVGAVVEVQMKSSPVASLGFGGSPAPELSTWPLLPLAAVGAWAGQAIAGGPRGRLAHTMMRPVSRGTWLLVRLGVLLGGLVLAGALLAVAATHIPTTNAGPPLVFVVGAIVACTLAGTFVGAIAEQENLAMGGVVVAAALLYGPVQSLLDYHDIALLRLQAGMGAWAWPLVLLTASTLLVPLAWVVRGLPARDVRRSWAAVALGIALVAGAYATVWRSSATNATRPGSGAVVAMSGQPGAPTVFYSRIGDAVDGVLVERDGVRVDLWGGGRERAEILDAKPSPDGSRLAIAADSAHGLPRRLIVLDLNGSARFETETLESGGLGEWSPDGRAFACSLAEVGMVAVFPDQRRMVAVAPGPTQDDSVIAWPADGLLIARDRNRPKPKRNRGPEPVPSFDVERVVIGIDGAVARRVVAEALPSTPVYAAGALAWTESGRDTPLVLSIMPLDGGDRVDVDLALHAWQPEFGWLDADHVYVLSPRRFGMVARLWIVGRDGTVVRDVSPQIGDESVFEVRGPPTGPWLTLSRYGTVVHLAPDGTVQSRRRVFNRGSYVKPWFPVRRDAAGLSLVTQGGVESIVYPWLESALDPAPERSPEALR